MFKLIFSILLLLSTDGLAYRRGLLNSNGSITWSAAEQAVLSSAFGAGDPNITVNSSGYPMAGYGDDSGGERGYWDF